MAPLSWIERRVKAHGADLSLAYSITNGTTTSPLSFSAPPDWDSDGFFNPSHPGRVTVPAGFAGRYAVRLTLVWRRASGDFTVSDRDKSFFYAELGTNADPSGRFAESRSYTAPVVGTTGTHQRALWEGPLAPGQWVEARARYGIPPTQPPAPPPDLNLEAWLHLRWLGMPA
jgi:hypothetical protein